MSRHVPFSCLGTLLLVLASTSARATPLQHGSSSAAMPGVLQTQSGLPSVRGAWFLLAGAEYAWQPAALIDGDSRQHAAGRLALGYSPWSFLQLSVSLDGTVDSYQWPDSSDSLVVGSLGDPRIWLRTGWNLGGGISMGGGVQVWFPSGRGTFAIEPESISPTVLWAMSFAPERFPLGLHLNVGYRYDGSIHMLGDVSQLTPEQLLLSGATNSAHQVLVRFAAEYRFGPAAPFVELASDLYLGDGGVEHSPVVVGAGARVWLGPRDAVQLTAGIQVRATDLPPPPDPVSATVYNAQPLLAFALSATFRLPVARETVTVVREGDGEHGETPPPPEPGRIAGRVVCDGSPCGPGTLVEVEGGGSSPLAADPDTGQFSSGDLRAGTYRVRATSPRREPQQQETVVEAGATASVELTLPAAAGAEPPGIRGRVTDFDGQPVRATIRVPALGQELQAAEDGSFNLVCDPGQYEVIVTASGFQTQHTRVEVTAEGVVVMNIELRQRR